MRQTRRSFPGAAGVVGATRLAGCSFVSGFAGASDGVFAAVSAGDGSEHWTVTVDWTRTDPVVDGTVFAGSD